MKKRFGVNLQKQKTFHYLLTEKGEQYVWSIFWQVPCG